MDTPGLWEPPTKEEIAQRVAEAVRGYRDFINGKSPHRTRARIEEQIMDVIRKTGAEDDPEGTWRGWTGYSIGLLEAYEDRRKK